jgi:hypothetical protein
VFSKHVPYVLAAVDPSLPTGRPDNAGARGEAVAHVSLVAAMTLAWRDCRILRPLAAGILLQEA